MGYDEWIKKMISELITNLVLCELSFLNQQVFKIPLIPLLRTFSRDVYWQNLKFWCAKLIVWNMFIEMEAEKKLDLGILEVFLQFIISVYIFVDYVLQPKMPKICQISALDNEVQCCTWNTNCKAEWSTTTQEI